MRGLVVSPGAFNRHMVSLWALGFKGLSMKDLLPYLQGERTGRVFGITFDDGYKEHYTNVFPILKDFGIKGSFYVTDKTVIDHQVLDVNKIHFILATVKDKKKIIYLRLFTV